MNRSKALQIYMKPGVREDDLMLRIWDACRETARPQDVFRAMLRAGLVAMVESGEMPDSVVDQCGLDTFVERKRRRAPRPVRQEQPAAPLPAPPFYPQPFPYYPQAPQPVAAPPAHYGHAPAPAPHEMPAHAVRPAAQAARPQAVPQRLSPPATPPVAAASAENARPAAEAPRDAAPPAPENEPQAATLPVAALAEAVPARKGRIGTLM